MPRPLCQDCNEAPRYRNASRCLNCLNAYRRERRANDPELKSRQDAWFAEYQQTDHYKQRRASDHQRRRLIDDEYRSKRMGAYHRRKMTIWQQILDAYGRKCECCGETEEVFLTIDHVNSDGYLSKGGPRSGEKLWRWLRDNDFPQDNFRLLCYNCNCGRERNGGICPHQVQ